MLHETLILILCTKQISPHPDSNNHVICGNLSLHFLSVLEHLTQKVQQGEGRDFRALYLKHWTDKQNYVDGTMQPKCR